MHLPCRITARTHPTEVVLAVNGEAIDASPSFTSAGSFCCSSISRDASIRLCFAWLRLALRPVPVPPPREPASSVPRGCCSPLLSRNASRRRSSSGELTIEIPENEFMPRAALQKKKKQKWNEKKKNETRSKIPLIQNNNVNHSVETGQKTKTRI